MSIQVPFVIESTSDTEKQFGRYFELCNETSRQVHKTSVDILYCYMQDLLMTQSSLNAAQFSHNDYIIVLMRCLSRFHL